MGAIYIVILTIGLDGTQHMPLQDSKYFLLLKKKQYLSSFYTPKTRMSNWWCSLSHVSTPLDFQVVHSFTKLVLTKTRGVLI